LLEKAVFGPADNTATAKEACAHWMTYASIWDFLRHTPDQSQLVNRMNRSIDVIMPLIGCHGLGKGAYFYSVVSWLQDGL
jgi:hypothetical protein